MPTRRIDEIEAAFCIEKVTNEFFDQYKALFVKLAEHLKTQPYFQQSSEEETGQAVSRFAKKLLGQIVFLYFLQKKGWLGVAKDERWGTVQALPAGAVRPGNRRKEATITTISSSISFTRPWPMNARTRPIPAITAV